MPDPRKLWVGTDTQVLLVDVVAGKVMATCSIEPLSDVHCIAAGPKAVMLVPTGGLYMIDKGWLPQSLAAAE